MERNNVIDAINYAYKSGVIGDLTAKDLIFRAQKKNVIDANKCAKIYSAIRSYKSGLIGDLRARELIFNSIK